MALSPTSRSATPLGLPHGERDHHATFTGHLDQRSRPSGGPRADFNRVTAASIAAAASRMREPGQRRDLVSGADHAVNCLAQIRRIYAGPGSDHRLRAGHGFPAKDRPPLTGAALRRWTRRDGSAFLPKGCIEAPKNPGVFLHPSGLVFSLSETEGNGSRGKRLLLTFGGTTAGLEPHEGNLARTFDNFGAFLKQWFGHNIPAHLGRRTEIAEAASNLLSAARQQTGPARRGGRAGYQDVMLAGHSLGAQRGDLGLARKGHEG